MRSGEKLAKGRPVGVAGVDHVAANPSPENRDAPRPLDPDAGNFLDRWFQAIAPSGQADTGPPGGHKLTEALRRADIEHAEQVLADAMQAAADARATLDRLGAPRGVVASQMKLPGETG